MFFVGKDSEFMLVLFRVVGVYYCNYFIIVILNGLTFKNDDFDCKLGYIYYVREVKCMFFRRGKFQKCGNRKILFFRKGIFNFFRCKFLTFFRWWVESVYIDEVVKVVEKDFVIEFEKFEFI